MNPIQWFPGHMAKTIKQLQQELTHVDIIIELLDARIPAASRNPIITRFIQDKHHHIIALTKCDLADRTQTARWVRHLKQDTPHVFELNIIKKKGIKSLKSHCLEQAKAKKKARRFYISKIMICGIPNVGKSALMNALAHKKVAQVQNKPGVTKQKKGIMLDHCLELIDTPGILWPKLDNQDNAIKLALHKAIKQTITDDYQLAHWLVRFLQHHYLSRLTSRYSNTCFYPDSEATIHSIATRMNWIKANHEINEQKAYRSLIEAFQKQEFGPTSLDWLA